MNSTDFCAACPVRFAGTFGVCRKCPDGSEPNLERSSCQQLDLERLGVVGLVFWLFVRKICTKEHKNARFTRFIDITRMCFV